MRTYRWYMLIKAASIYACGEVLLPLVGEQEEGSHKCALDGRRCTATVSASATRR